MAALTDAAGDANGKKGGKKSKGGTTVQGDKEKSDIFKLVSVFIVSLCKLSSCDLPLHGEFQEFLPLRQTSCASVSHKRQRRSPGIALNSPVRLTVHEVPRITGMLFMAVEAC